MVIGSFILKTPPISQHIEAVVVWMNEEDLDPSKDFWIKHGTQYVHVNVDSIQWKMNMETLERIENVQTLSLNDIACVRLTAHRPIAFDAYRNNRASGAFIMIDFMTNNTVSAGMIEGAFEKDQSSITSLVTNEQRTQVAGQKGSFYWITAEDSDAASKLAFDLEQRLVAKGTQAVVIDSNDARYDKLHSATEALRLATRLLDLELTVIFHSDASDLLYAMERFSVRQSARVLQHIVEGTPQYVDQQWYTFTQTNADSV